jgi:hypothetical protein
MTSERHQRNGIALALALLAGCADLARGPAPSPAPDGAGEASTSDGGSDGAALSFAADVHALLVAGCQHCHSTGQEAGDSSLLLTGGAADDFTVTSRFVDVSSPATSRLLAKMAGNSSHGGGTVYAMTSPEYQTILRWIQEGARP